MYFSTNVMFRTLHSNSTIYLSTWLPSGDVKLHAVVPKTLIMGVGRLTANTVEDNIMMWHLIFRRVASVAVKVRVRVKCFAAGEMLVCVDQGPSMNG